MIKKINCEKIQVNSLKLSHHLNDVAGLETYLSIKEIEKANRFKFERDRTRFIIGRAFLRKMLGNILNFDPSLLNIEADVYGKPFLSNEQHRHLHFNLSHSGDYIIYAFSPDSNIGIDIEKINPSIDHLEIARRYFSSREIAFLNETKNGHKVTELFYLIWSRKEALLKAVGTGLLPNLKDIDVLKDSIDLFAQKINSSRTIGSKWTIHDLFVHVDYKAAVSYSDDPRQVNIAEYFF